MKACCLCASRWRRKKERAARSVQFIVEGTGVRRHGCRIGREVMKERKKLGIHVITEGYDTVQ
jgi:hypothetical protein